MKWIPEDHKIQIVPPKRPKKLTGTRFAAIFNFNPWVTPFEIWCEITKTYSKPFEDTIYTAAGKVIEPKQAQYIKDKFAPNLISPTDIYGPDYFKKTYGDFFPQSREFGGMWDYLAVDPKTKEVVRVFEMKTTKRAEDWQDDIPEYYALQAALYAYLLGVDSVVMVASFLEDKDYAHPEDFVCDSFNTIIRSFKVSERYPNFEKAYIIPAQRWWDRHIVKGISPEYDEKKDAEILKELRTNNISPESDIKQLISEAEELKAKLDKHSAEVADDEKRYKIVCDQIKQLIIPQFREGDKKVSAAGAHYNFEISKSSTLKINKEALSTDGLLDKYSSTEDSYRITIKEI